MNSDSLNHSYTPGSGHPLVRQAVADYLAREHGIEFSPELIVMTVGAAGALNNVFKALMDPGEEILVPSPYFVGYDQYAFLADVARLLGCGIGCIGRCSGAGQRQVRQTDLSHLR